jgi:hypothetical protein
MLGVCLSIVAAASPSPAQAASSGSQAGPGAQPAATPSLPTGPALTEAVRAASDAMFGLWFERCDLASLRRMTAPDSEFYHDVDGASAGAEAEFALYAERCPPGHAGRPRINERREPVPGSQRIFPVPGYGAIEEGEHWFWRRGADGIERRTSYAKYVQLWRLTPNGWVAARAFSYDHRDLAPGG